MCIRDRFYLVHFPGKLLFDAFPQSYIVGTDNIAKEINAFFYREYPVSYTHLDVYKRQVVVMTLTATVYRGNIREIQSSRIGFCGEYNLSLIHI